MALKEYKKQVYSTPMDVRLMSAELFEKETYTDKIFLDDPRVEKKLLEAKGIIDIKLASVIGGESSFEVTPYSGAPLIPSADIKAEGENSGTGKLYGSQPATTAYTELWTITFGTAPAFTIVGSYSGSQGSGTTASDFTTTDSDLVVPSDAWSGSPSDGDIIYIPVYKHHPSIVVISTMLATALLAKGYNSNAEDDTPIMELYDKALELLDDVVASDGDLLGVSNKIDSSDIMVPYEVSIDGYDITNYKTDEFARYAGNTYYTAWYCR